MPIKRNPDKCDEYVYKYGEVYATLPPMSNEEAELACQDVERAHPTWDVDYHNVAGRVVIKIVDPETDKKRYDQMKARYE